MYVGVGKSVDHLLACHGICVSLLRCLCLGKLAGFWLWECLRRGPEWPGRHWNDVVDSLVPGYCAGGLPAHQAMHRLCVCYGTTSASVGYTDAAAEAFITITVLL